MNVAINFVDTKNSSFSFASISELCNLTQLDVTQKNAKVGIGILFNVLPVQKSEEACLVLQVRNS